MSQRTMQDRLKRRAEIEAEVRKLKTQLSALEDEKDELDEDLMEDFMEIGVQSMTMNGFTFYIHRQTWAYALPKDEGGKQESITRLRKAGFEDYVYEDFNVMSVSALVRQYEQEAETVDVTEDDEFAAVPHELREALRLQKKVQIRARSAN